jgi:hypothetical protein
VGLSVVWPIYYGPPKVPQDRIYRKNREKSRIQKLQIYGQQNPVLVHNKEPFKENLFKVYEKAQICPVFVDHIGRQP